MMKKLLVWMIKGYKKFISPAFPNRCVYTPSCSSYALEALSKHSFIYASLLIIKRLIKCNPLSSGGFDPVPDKKSVVKWLL